MPKLAPPPSPTRGPKKRAPARKSGVAATPKETLLRIVRRHLDKLGFKEIQSLNALIEKRSTSGKTIVTASLPDHIVGATLEFKMKDGSTYVDRVDAPRHGFILLEPQRSTSALERAHARYSSLRNEIVAQSLPLRQAAHRMNLTPEGLSGRVERREMLAFPEANKKMVPIELIDDMRPDRTVNGLADVLKASSMEPFSLAVWLLSPVESLGAKRPVDELRAGHIERVVQAIQGVGAT